MKSWLTHRSVLLAIALFFQAEGMLLVSVVQQFFNGIQMSRKLANENGHFQLLSLPLETYLKSKINNHEVSLNGEMFDVRTVDLCGDTATLLVIRDRKEENLLEKIGDYFRVNKPDNKPNPISLYQLLTEKYIAPSQNNDGHFLWSGKYAFSFLYLFPTNSIPELPGPPPKMS